MNDAVEVCAICDIAGCYHIRERKARAETALTAAPTNPLADERVQRLVDLIKRAEHNVPEYYTLWHSDVRAALSAIEAKP